MTAMPWLTVLWAVPMVGAVAGDAGAHGAHRPRQVRRTRASRSWSSSSRHGWPITFDPAGAQYQFVEDHDWIPSFGTGYILGLDGIALALVVLTAVLVPILIVAGWNDGKDNGTDGADHAGRRTPTSR